MPPTAPGPAATQLLKSRDNVEKAVEVIDHDPEEAAAILAPAIKAAPNVGEITQQDMFQLMSQMQTQMAAMQNQILSLMNQPNPQKPGHDTKAELDADRMQREATLKTWDTEPREPTYLAPEADELKIQSVTGKFPPRTFYVNGLLFPVPVGEIAHVPSSIARMVETTQRRRPYTGAPQGLGNIPDPMRAQFLAGSQAVEIGRPGTSGAGRLIPDALPPQPQPLGLKYDQNGQ